MPAVAVPNRDTPRPVAERYSTTESTLGKMGDGRPVTNGAVGPTGGGGGIAHSTKKSKGKKNPDPADTSKLLEQTIAQLERNKTNDREQELEIEREVKKSSRELISSMTGYDALAKAEYLQKKCAQLFAEMKRLEREHQKTKRRADQLQKERDTAKSELSKMTTIKDKLEKLSRETSNENRKLRADLQRSQEEDNRRRQDLHEKIDTMVFEVEDVIHSKELVRNYSETHDTDELFRQKFKSFVDQYEMREVHFQSLLRTKDLEVQYHIAQLEQQRRQQEAESTRSNQLTRQVSTFSQTETELRNQLNIYVEKFKQVEDTLNSSNDLFLTFRKEMEETSKKTKRLEKENLALTRKQDATNNNIIKMAEERSRTQNEIELLRRKNLNLENLCRGMQAQGRGQSSNPPTAPHREVEDEDDGTESPYDDDYDEDEDEDEGSLANEDFDEDSSDEPIQTSAASAATLRPIGIVAMEQTKLAGRTVGSPANGVKA